MSDLIKREDAIKALEQRLIEDSIIYRNCIPNTDEVRFIAEATLKDIPAVEPWDLYNPDEWCRDCKEYDTEKHNCPRWNRVIRRTLEENQPKQEWIPCEERLPNETGKDYLVTIHHRETNEVYIDCFQYDDIGGWWSNLNDVIAWMPLPPSYEGEAEKQTDCPWK